MLAGTCPNRYRTARSCPESAQKVSHVSMEAHALYTALSALVRVALSAPTFDLLTGPARPVAALRLRIAELVRQRDTVQELATVPGANVAKAKEDLSRLGAEIDTVRGELDAALASDITTAGVRAALAIMAARDEFLVGDDPADDWSTASEAWTSYWQGLPVEDRRALIQGLGLRPLLWPAGAPQRLTAR